MKTQPQRLLEEIVPLPEWVHDEWHKEIANKWAIREAGEKLADALRIIIDSNRWFERGKVALEQWEKLLNEPTKPVV